MPKPFPIPVGSVPAEERAILWDLHRGIDPAVVAELNLLSVFGVTTLAEKHGIAIAEEKTKSGSPPRVDMRDPPQDWMDRVTEREGELKKKYKDKILKEWMGRCDYGTGHPRRITYYAKARLIIRQILKYSPTVSKKDMEKRMGIPAHHLSPHVKLILEEMEKEMMYGAKDKNS